MVVDWDGALPVPYAPGQVTRSALVAHRHTHKPQRCRTSQYHRTFLHVSESLGNDLDDPVFEGVEPSGFKSRANLFSLA